MSNWLSWSSSWFGRTITPRDGKFWSSFFGGANFAQEPMNAEIAMQIAAVWKCIRLISSTVASLPLGLVSTDGKFREDRSLTIDMVIRDSPNATLTAMEFWEAIIGCQELVGNGFAHKVMNGAGEVSALALLNPWGMSWKRLENNRIEWTYTDDRGRKHTYRQDEIFHLKQFSFDGEMGLSTVQYGAQTLGSSRAADRTAGQMFSTGLSASGFLETAQILQGKDRTDLQNVLKEYRGQQGVGKLMILEAGMKFNPISMSAQDAQLLTSRRFNIEEICRWFDVPPILCGHNPEGGTQWGTGAETIILGWLVLGLRNRLVRIQQAIRKQLMPAPQRLDWTPKFNIDGLLQGDSTARANLITSYLQNGVYNPNYARALLNLAPYDGGDLYLRQVNLAPADTLGQKRVEDAQIRSMVRSWLGVEDAPKPVPPTV